MQYRLLSSVNTTTSIRRHFLELATSELQRVTQHYLSDEFRNTTADSETAPSILETTTDVRRYLQNIDTVLFDCDGVLYRSPHPTPDAGRAIQSLIQQQRKRLLFVTNNGSVSRTQLRQRITSILQLSDDLLTDDMMISSAYACAQYLKQQLPKKSTDHTTTDTSQNEKRHVFCIGSEGLCNELMNAGFIVSHGNDEVQSSMSRDDLAGYHFPTLLQRNNNNSSDNSNDSSSNSNTTIDAVVVGHDTNFTYRKLSIATVLLQWNPKAPLIATNLDAYDLTGTDGRHIPGNGALVKAVSVFSVNFRRFCIASDGKYGCNSFDTFLLHVILTHREIVCLHGNINVILM
jgi:HAD superfamily hydrolase (TIGR01450 family)